MGQSRKIDYPTPIDVTAQTAKSLPALLQAYAANAQPFEQAMLNAQKVIEPQQLQHAIDLYQQYGAQSNAIGNDIARQNQLAAAQRELETVQGPGRGLVQEALSLDQLVNPDFYKNRGGVNDSLMNLIGSVNPNALTPTEEAETQRFLARSGELPGNNSWKYAQTFGNALNQKKDRLASILSLAPGILSSTTRNLDPFKIATGRDSFVPNTGEARLPGYNPNFGANVVGIGQGVYGNTSNLLQNKANYDQNILNQNSVWNRAMQGSQIFQNVLSGLSSATRAGQTGGGVPG